MKALGIVAVLGTALLTGCTGSTAAGHRYDLYRDAQGREVLGHSACRQRTATCAAVTPARVTNDPNDEEFWQFEARISVYANNGFSYGRKPRDVNVIGSQQTCEALRARFADAKGPWGQGRDKPPTEPCRGPFFFRREPVPGTTPGASSAPVEYSGAPYAHLGIAGGPADFADQFYGDSAEDLFVVGEPDSPDPSAEAGSH